MAGLSDLDLQNNNTNYDNLKPRNGNFTSAGQSESNSLINIMIYFCTNWMFSKLHYKFQNNDFF